MTVQNQQSVVPALPDLERRNPPAALYLAGTVVVMNVCATVLSLMA
jgi:hypothetical protein